MLWFDCRPVPLGVAPVCGRALPGWDSWSCAPSAIRHELRPGFDWRSLPPVQGTVQTLRESSVEHVGLGCVLFLWGRGRGRSHIISDSSEGDNHFFFRRRYCLTSSYMKSIFLPRLLLIIVAQYFGRFFSCKWRLRIERICWAVFSFNVKPEWKPKPSLEGC